MYFWVYLNKNYNGITTFKYNTNSPFVCIYINTNIITINIRRKLHFALEIFNFYVEYVKEF